MVLRLLIALIFLWSSSADAYPEFALSHGYSACGACHHNASGGGPLTAYGRSLSSEGLSTWSVDGEADLGRQYLPEWLIVAGNVRSIYVGSKETPYKHIPMQKELKLGVDFGPLAAVGSYGLYNDRAKESRSHYVSFKPFDFLAFRTGKFLPNYGIMWPDHTLITRGYLGYGENSEVYGNEYAVMTKYGEIFVTSVDKTKELDKYTPKNKGSIYRLSIFPYKGVVLGANSALMTDRKMYGGFLEWMYNERAFIAYEGSMLYALRRAPEYVSYGKLSYELFRGINLFYDNNFSLYEGVPTRINSIGLSLFPRPHFEFTGKVYKGATIGSYVTANFYL